MLKKRKAQAVLEYIIILAAIVAGLVCAQPLVQQVVQGMIQQPVSAAGAVTNSISF